MSDNGSLDDAVLITPGRCPALALLRRCGTAALAGGPLD